MAAPRSTRQRSVLSFWSPATGGRIPRGRGCPRGAIVSLQSAAQPSAWRRSPLFLSDPDAVPGSGIHYSAPHVSLQSPYSAVSFDEVEPIPWRAEHEAIDQEGRTKPGLSLLPTPASGSIRGSVVIKVFCHVVNAPRQVLGSTYMDQHGGCDVLFNPRNFPKVDVTVLVNERWLVAVVEEELLDDVIRPAKVVPLQVVPES